MKTAKILFLSMAVVLLFGSISHLNAQVTKADVPTLKLNNGMEMPQLGIGTFAISYEDAKMACLEAFKNGFRHVDCATAYRVEGAVGEAMKESGIPREEFFIASKLWVSDYADGKTLASIDTILKRFHALEAAGGEIRYVADTKSTDEMADRMPFDLYREGHYYYNRTHAHPNSTFRYTMSSLLDLMAFDAADNMDLINQPLLMMAGSKADTFYMTEDAFNLASGTDKKELFLIPGATHIQTYHVPEYVNQAMGKLIEFFGKNL